MARSTERPGDLHAGLRLGDERPARTFDVAAFIDGRGLSPFNKRLILLSWLITMFDGFDMQVIAYTAPYMREQLSLDLKMMGVVISAGTLGMVLGGLGFSWLGDRIGRRPATLLTSVLFGVLTVGLALARSYHQLVFMRFVDGLAIGGMLPLAWALNIEFVPRSMRAYVVTIIMMGYSFGSAIGGPLTNWVAPHFGWQGVYVVGGVGSLLSAGALFAYLPESVRYLVAKERRPDLVAATLRRVDPSLDVRPDDRFVIGDEQAVRRFRPRELFRHGLAPVTVLIWTGYLVSSFAIYFSSSWNPTILEALGTSRRTAALVSSLSGILGALAGVVLVRATERHGPGWIAVYPLLAIPALVTVGLGLLPTGLFLPMVVLGALFVGGGHTAVISITGIYYPSAIRASGAGWAASIGKAGGTIAPVLGAFILSSGLPVQRSFALLAVCPLVLGICLLALGAYVRTRVAPSPAPELAVA